jgi:signal transduction histidine kinase
MELVPWEEPVADGFMGGSASAREAFAALIEADRAQILAAYVRGLEEIDSPIVRERMVREQAIANGVQVLADVTRSLRAGRVHLSDAYKAIAWDIGEAKGARGLHTRESLRAATVFFQVTITFVARHLIADEMSLQLFTLVLFALNQSLNTRVSELTTAYTGFLLSKVHEAHVAERHRIGRELHDRIGNTLSVAHRQLELYHVHEGTDTIRGSDRIEAAHRSIVESMESLRVMTSDLRLQERIGNLEKALTAYLEATQASEVKVCLRVNGDESWAPSAVRDESFFVIREAIHNALTHGAPSTVLVGVDITPDGLRACVEDDGCGFDSPCARPRRGGGVGLLSMRERAALMGGNVTVSSTRSHGTSVELLVPLSGYQNDATS